MLNFGIFFFFLWLLINVESGNAFLCIVRLKEILPLFLLTFPSFIILEFVTEYKVVSGLGSSFS